RSPRERNALMSRSPFARWSRFFRARPAGSKAPARSRSWFRPGFERLEDRLTPATRVWSGVASPDWNNASNWVGGAVPSNGDDLIFPGGPQAGLTNNNLVGAS